MSLPSFTHLGVPEDLVRVLAGRGIETPFPIQAASLADAIAGRDICGHAPTGSGKTLAFGLPLVLNAGRPQARRPSALVLVPTRELAAQVQRELAPLAAARNRRIATVYGGVGYGPQREALRRGVDTLVACPGRLEDLIAQGDVRLDNVGFCVVDEADRMADMGFLPAVKRLLEGTRSDRQTLLYSATLDGDVDVLVRRYQREPARHSVAQPAEERGTVRHHFWRVERSERIALTAQLVERCGSVLVFCRTRHGADRLSKQLTRSGVGAAAIHGSRTQPQRDRALHAFSTGRVQALVATDVAARGIHVDDVNCVLHFDPPGTGKDYVHRSGRTGRAGAEGAVVSFVGREHTGAVRGIQKDLRMPRSIDEPDVGRLAAGTARTPATAQPNRSTQPNGSGHRNNGHRNGAGGRRRRARR